MNFKFKSELNDNTFDEISSTPIEYENLYNFSRFAISIVNHGMSVEFSSGVSSINLETIENFVNKFKAGENDSISFNQNSGSIIAIENNTIFFNVYTWKEGTITDLDIKIELDDEIRLKLIDIFTELLIFKNRYNSIPIIDDDDCSYIDDSDDNEQSDDNDPSDDVDGNDNDNDESNNQNINTNQQIDL